MDILNSLNELSPEQQELLAELLKQQGIDISEYVGGEDKYSSIKPIEKRDFYAVSSAQKRLYVLSQMDETYISYNMPGYMQIEGRIDKERFQQVFSDLVQRHEAFRTYFEVINGEPVQKIVDSIDFKVDFVECSENELSEILKEFIKPFDLSKAPLLRVKIISTSEEKHMLAFDNHHIISDAITMGIIINEISMLYNGAELEPLKLQYKDFAIWQNDLIESGKIDKQEQHWLETFKGDIPVLNLPTDFPRPSVRGFEGNSIVVTTSKSLADKLNKLSKETGATLYIVLLSAYNILLSKYSAQEDIIVGCPVAGRSHADLENIAGMFVNTVAMRNNVDRTKSFMDFMKEVKENSLKAYENQDYQFEMLVEKLNVRRDLSRNPIFDTVFVMQNTGDAEFDIKGLKFTPFEAETKISKFDMTINVEELTEGINLDVEYSTKLFREETIYRLIGHYINILEQIVANREIRISDIEVVTDIEKKQILEDFNNTKADYPRNKTIKDIFEEQAEKTPDNIAVAFEDHTMTYRELNQKANQLAHVLRSKGVGAESIVGLLVERSVEMIVGIIAILKAGGAYLPIDPMYPEDRINFMLEDSGAKILLTKAASVEIQLSDANKENLTTIDFNDASIFVSEVNNLDTISNSESLAYIIYTSGTTGKPKGAMIMNKNVVRLMFNDKIQFDFSDSDVWTMFHSMSFDFSVWEMYGALLYGGKLVIVPKIVAQDPLEFIKLMKKEGVTVLNQTPTAFSNIVREEAAYPEKELSIRYVVFGGEALKPAMLKDWKKKYPETKLINMYGITETTVHVTFKEITEVEINANISNIGIPIPTLTTYIMDKNLKLLPIGVAGELCVGGDGVCRGYLNRPELTAEKFVENPYVKGERLYRSGDLAKFLPDGEMEYLGRIDHQVKIRGHRIELGEIESKLMKHMSIDEAVVLAKEDARGDKFLCAYIVANQEIDVKALRGHLAKDCPEYMIPSFFVQLDSMPLTSNGKVDKKALPEPYDSVDAGVEYAAPENELEEKLVQSWQQVLGIEKIGVNDSFFSIGGDSIKAISLISSINKLFGTSLQMKDIYINQTVRELAVSLDSAEGSQTVNERLAGLKKIEEMKNEILESGQAVKLPADWDDFYPLSQIQNGMVFYSKLRPEDPIYHDQFIFPVRFKQFDYDTYIKALKVLMKKHQILRTVFDTYSFNTPIQIVLKDIDPIVLMQDVSSLTKAEQEARIRDYIKVDMNNKFKFDNDLLWRIGLFRVAKDDFFIILSFQHAILDGWSVSAFNKDFIEIFSKLINNEEYELQPIQSTYKDYVAISLTRQTSEKTKKFWRDLLEGYSRNKLPFNISGKRINGLEGSKIYRRALGKELLEKVNKQAKKYNCAVRDICLSSHLYLMSLVSTESDVVSGMVTHDRPVIEDSEKILGCFLNTIPVRMKIDRNANKLELLENVKKYLRDVKEHELFLSDIAAATGNIGGTENPIFDVLFNFTDFHVLKDVEGEDTLKESDYDLYVESNEMTNTLFDLEVSKTMDTFSMQIKYAPGYFYEADIEMAMNLYIRVLEKFIDDDVELLNVEDLVTQVEKNQLLYEFNNTIVEYPTEKLMHQLFEEQAEKTPDNTAIKLEAEEITYRELNQRANRLARLLVEAGVKSGDNVGLVMYRGFDMVAGMLGILKAGGAYVPVDPDYPQERRAYIAESAKITAMVVYKGFKQEYSEEGISNIIELDYEQLDKYSAENLNIVKDSADLAYIIYTSGSTGQPKGVMIEHHMAVNLICWVNKEYQVTEKDTLLFITSMCFDLSVYDIFGILAAGGKIVIGKKEQVQNPKELTSLLTKEKITFWDSVPSTMNYIVNSLEEIGEEYVQNDLRIVFMSGDWIPVKLPERLKKYFPNARPISLGGATEGTIWSIYYPIQKVTEYQSSIPYGRPMDNNFFYILDDNMNILPRGVAGELCIGGVGVARGYMNNEEKTKAAFVRDRFRTQDKHPKNQPWMMYKTGDLGRMLPDMTIEFLGRKDHQVKIRGYRVELGEIESQLQLHELIKDAVVTDRADAAGNKYLCAYIVSEHEITVQEMREYLATKLPDYMIPTYFMYMDKLPLTSNGKIDRKNLPQPEGNIETGTEYVAPTNEVEEKLAAIWQEILEVEKVGINDSFFELGGHSLKATTLTSKIHKELNIEVPLKEIFSTPTVREIALYIQRAEKSSYIQIEAAPKKEHYPLSPAQKRLFLLNIKEEASISYNTPDSVLITGKLDADRLNNVFKEIVNRHESFRTSFEIIEGEPVQIIHENIDFNIERFTVKEDEVADLLKEFVRPFDLSKAPLLRVKLMRIDDERHVLAYDMHHIISDGLSMIVMIDEFSRLYNGEALRPLRIQYKDFSEWQNKRIIDGTYSRQEAYWLDRFKGELPQISLPTDYQRPEIQSFEGSSLSIHIGSEIKEKLEVIVKETGSTMYMMLLSAFNVLLSKYSGQEDIIVGSPISGRAHSDLENIIGMFVNTLAMRNYPVAEKSFNKFLAEVKENSLKAYENQDYQFQELVEKLEIKRDFSRNPLFDVVFVMQSASEGEVLELSDIAIKAYQMNRDSSKFDLTLEVSEIGNTMNFRFEYCTKLFTEETIQRLSDDYLKIIDYVLQNPEMKLSDMVLQSKYQEKESVISEDISFNF